MSNVIPLRAMPRNRCPGSGSVGYDNVEDGATGLCHYCCQEIPVEPVDRRPRPMQFGYVILPEHEGRGDL